MLARGSFPLVGLLLALALSGCEQDIQWDRLPRHRSRGDDPEATFRHDRYECLREAHQITSGLTARTLFVWCMEARGYQRR